MLSQPPPQNREPPPGEFRAHTGVCAYCGAGAEKDHHNCHWLRTGEEKTDFEVNYTFTSSEDQTTGITVSYTNKGSKVVRIEKRAQMGNITIFFMLVSKELCTTAASVTFKLWWRNSISRITSSTKLNSCVTLTFECFILICA